MQARLTVGLEGLVRRCLTSQYMILFPSRPDQACSPPVVLTRANPLHDPRTVVG
jgi:hypothetical protein